MLRMTAYVSCVCGLSECGSGDVASGFAKMTVMSAFSLEPPKDETTLKYQIAVANSEGGH